MCAKIISKSVEKINLTPSRKVSDSMEIELKLHINNKIIFWIAFSLIFIKQVFFFLFKNTLVSNTLYVIGIKFGEKVILTVVKMQNKILFCQK